MIGRIASAADEAVAQTGYRLFWIDSSGNGFTSASMRAPIFYDSNNTGYYGDFASTSVFNILNFPSGSAAINTTTPGTGTYQLNFTGQGTPDNAQAITWGWSTSGAQAGIYVQSSGSYGTKMYLATTDSFASGSKTAMSIDHSGIITTTRNYLQATGSLRAPIFYDSNNTGYYLDPASTSELNKVYYNSNMVSRNYGIGQVGLYDSTRFQAVFAMGESYLLAADGTGVGNLYGIAWSYPSAGGAAGNLASHGMLILENGVFKGAWGGGSLRTPSDIRGTLYYDWDNTGFYVDPASTSITNDMRATIFYDRANTGFYVQPSVTSILNDCRASIFYDRDNTGYYVNPAGDTQLAAVYANNYFRAQGSTGLYLQDYAYYFDRNPDTYGNFRCGVTPQNSYVGIAYLYSSSRMTTMFDSGGNGGLFNYSYWIYYWLTSNACLGVRTSTTSASYAMYVEGGIYSTGNIVAYSDIRKKTNIVTVDNALNTVAKLRGVYYNRIETNDEKVDPNKRQIGVIAQEVNEVLPEVVTYAKDVDEYGVQYGNMAGLFIEAIKELKAEIEELKQRLR
jgi:hypothetical protein